MATAHNRAGGGVWQAAPSAGADFYAPSDGLVVCWLVFKSTPRHGERPGRKVLVGGALQIKSASPGGLEPPTFRLTAERANRLRHGDETTPRLVCSLNIITEPLWPFL